MLTKRHRLPHRVVRSGYLMRLLLVLPSFVVACSLLVPFDDLTTGQGEQPDGAPRPQSGVDGSGAPETGAPVDASTDGASVGDDAGASPYRELVVSHAPIAYWRLADREGDVATDEMGNAHPGLYYGGYQLGVPGFRSGESATRFNGSSACVYVGNFFQFANRLPFSVEAWIRPISLDAGALIVGTTGPGDSVRSGWSLMYTGSAAPFFEGWADNGDGGSDYVLGVYSAESAGGPLVVGAWTHLVATFDATEETIWMDGVLRGRLSQSERSLPATAHFAIGCGGDGSGSITLGVHGDLADVAIYDRVLPEVQITAHQALGRGL